ncbi:hypothetical protein H0H93_006740 [Arthromyces matolae]|nr:hypothetical protein H0H93_006740 [Arthromyces matolae]
MLAYGFRPGEAWSEERRGIERAFREADLAAQSSSGSRMSGSVRFSASPYFGESTMSTRSSLSPEGSGGSPAYEGSRYHDSREYHDWSPYSDRNYERNAYYASEAWPRHDDAWQEDIDAGARVIENGDSSDHIILYQMYDQDGSEETYEDSEDGYGSDEDYYGTEDLHEAERWSTGSRGYEDNDEDDDEDDYDDYDDSDGPFFPLCAESLPSTATTMYRYVKSASITATALGTIVNFTLAVQVLTASRSLKWEPESEWEASSDTWQIDGVKVIWGLCCAYFTLAAVVCIVGFTGILRRKPALVRFYRDYSIADFSFCTFVSIIATYAMFHASNRAALCEELSHHPELLQNLTDMGLTLENCERWLEGAGFAFVAVMFVLLVIRLHFLLAVANFYSIFSKQAHLYSRSPSHLHFDDLLATQRIYLLPPSDEESRGGDDVELPSQDVILGRALDQSLMLMRVNNSN